jgi:hypothetical protein
MINNIEYNKIVEFINEDLINDENVIFQIIFWVFAVSHLRIRFKKNEN